MLKCFVLGVLLTIVADGCGPSQPQNQAKAIKHLTGMQGERILLDGIGSGKITVRIPWNLGRGEGWNDEQFLACVPHLQQIPQLHTLDFTFSKVSDAGMSGLEKLPQIRVVNISTTFVSDAGLEPLRHLVNLETLVCDNSLIMGKEKGDGQEYNGDSLHGTGVEHLRLLPKLSALTMTSSPINDAGALAILHLPHLKELDLSRTKLTDEGVASLATMQSLKALSLSSPRITDAALDSLGTMIHLKRLTIGGKQLSAGALDDLRGKLLNTEVIITNN